VPFKDIKLKDDEAAAMFAGGPRAVDPYIKAIDDRNSELTNQIFDGSAQGLQVPVAVYADSEASSWYATRLFKNLAPDAWKVPDLASYGDARNKPRGIDASFALADPSFALSITTVTGEPPLQKALSFAGGPGTQGGVWILTDLAIAKSLNLTPVKLSATEGNFVGPTQANVLAALPSMKADDQGILLSDPKSTPAGAYPMTFVEYALVPTEPLVNADCSPRTASESLLKDWLTYITGDGQQTLTETGLMPLTGDLKAQAADAIKKVGTASITGTCAAGAGGATPAASAGSPSAAAPDLAIPSPAAAIPSPTVGSPLPAGPSDLPAAGTSVDSGAPALPTADTTAGAGAAGDTTNLHELASATPPPFAGRQSASWAPTVFALLGVIVLSSIALVATTKNR
jgi:hypothetical protein